MSETIAYKKSLLFAAIGVLGAVAWVPAAQALCFGQAGSATGCTGPGGSCQGTRDNNFVFCTVPGGCVMDGRAGDDLLHGERGSDLICGGSGNDVSVGAGGADEISGDGDADVAIGDSDFLPLTDGDDECNAELTYTCLVNPRPSAPLSGDVSRETSQ